MDNLKNLREFKKLLANPTVYEKNKLDCVFLISLVINNNPRVRKYIDYDKFDNIFENPKEIHGYFKKEIQPYISILYNDFSLYYFDERTEAEFMPKETYVYRLALNEFLKLQDVEKANKYLDSLKEYVKQNKAQEKEVLKYIRQSLNATEQDILNAPNNEFRKSQEACYSNDEKWLEFYQDALSNNKDTI